MSRSDEALADLIEYLARCAPAARARLSARLGVVPSGTYSGFAAKIQAACAKPDAVAHLLHGLPEPAVDLLDCWALRTFGSTGRRTIFHQTYVEDPIAGAERTQALGTLVEEGLGLSLGSGAYVDVLPAAREALAAHAGPAYTRTSCVHQGTPAPAAFAFALAVGLFDLERPLVRADGALHAHSLKRILARLKRASLLGLRLEAAQYALLRLGALQVAPHGHTNALRIDARRVGEVFDLDAGRLVRALLWDTARPSPTLWTYGRIVAAVRGASSPGGTGGVTLLDVLRTRVPGPDPHRTRAEVEPPDGWDTGQLLHSVAYYGLVALPPEGAPPRIRLREPEPYGTAPWVVQPTFDVLVPWDAPPPRVARLGLCADLEHLDRVCRFRLTPASVRRAGEHLLDGPAVLALLEEGAGAPLAQNVRATIAGWAARGRPLRPVRGEIVLISDPEQAAAFRALAPEAREVAAGVLLLPDGSLEQTLDKARAAGMSVAPTEGTPPHARGEFPSLTPEGAETRVRTYMDLVAAASEPPAKQSSARVPASVVRDLLRELAPDLDQDLTPRGRGFLEQLARDAAPDEEEDEDDSPLAVDWVGRPSAAPASERVRGHSWFDLSSGSSTTQPARKDGAPGPAPNWSVPLPGLVRERLRSALDEGRSLRLLYRNAEGKTIDRLVTPKVIQKTPRGEVVHARDEERHADCTLVLERIAALADEHGARAP